MSRIHFLNVDEGDCSVIQHVSRRTTVIDVCNAMSPRPFVEKLRAEMGATVDGANGDFRQKDFPVNPVSYLRAHGIDRIFRYIQTHPDMDHMDGIGTLFDTFGPLNFWDTNNRKQLRRRSLENSRYSEDDWDFYTSLRDGQTIHSPKRLALHSGDTGQYWNRESELLRDGDGLYVLAPTEELVAEANDADDDYNSCSYVLLYRVGGHRVVFGGDSHDETWDHILAHYESQLQGIDLLIAPHHGRDSGRSYGFLDVLRPKLTFFGNARCQHLAYDAWNRRGLAKITNNQANCMVVKTDTSPMSLFVTHKPFAQRCNRATSYDDSARAWYIGEITDNMVLST